MVDYYTRNEYIKINGYNFLYDGSNHDIKKIIETCGNLNIKGIKVNLDNDTSLENDEYIITVSYTECVKISYNSKRALCYAIDTLQKLEKNNSLPICKIHDKPDFEIRGVIEGFYGEPYTFDTRMDVIDFSKDNRLNSFFYAPKDDLYHRSKWKELYPEEILTKIKKLYNHAINSYIDFFFCISPGVDYDYLSANDFKLLTEKIDQVISFGINRFCLLMDDIPLQLNEEQTAKFVTVGAAHCDLCNKFNAYLKNRLNDYTLIFCPTDYFQNFDTPYRQDVKKNLNNDVLVFWTGYNTIAEKIDEEDAKIAHESFGHDLVLWDNYPVNDFVPKERIYLGPITNRSKNLNKYHKGFIINPSSNWYLSKIPAITMANYAYDSSSYDKDKSLKQAVLDFSKPGFENDIALFVELNYSNTMEISKYDLEFKKLYEESNYQVLEQKYLEIEKMVEHLKKYPDDKFLLEATPYLEYIEDEITLFKQILENRVDEKLVDKMIDSKVRTSNQEILKHINDKKVLNKEIKIFEGRTNFWRYQDEHKK